MKNPKDDYLTPDEKLNLENEMRALNLELNYGAQHFSSGKLSPQETKEWLDLVEEREAKFQAAKKIPIYELIGKPKFIPADTIADEDLEASVKEIETLLEEHQVLIVHPEYLPMRAWYRFLVEDFFEHKVSSYRAPTIFHTYSYEEFRHDGPEFARMHAQDAIEDILDLSMEYEGLWLTDPCRSDRIMVPQSEIFKKVEAFRSKYQKIIPIGFSPMEFKSGGPSMFFVFGIEWDGILAGSGEKEHYEGMGICQMAWEEGEWMVQGVDMPGFKF